MSVSITGMAPPHSQSDLLSLPREIRDEILLYATQASWNATGPNIPPLYGQSSPNVPLSYFDCEHGKWQPIALRWVNRQLRSEISDMIASQRSTAKEHNFEADNATQTSTPSPNKLLPTKRTKIPTLELQVRTLGRKTIPHWTHLNYSLQPQSSLDLHVNLTILSTEGFQRPPDGPSHAFSTLQTLLNLFLFQGPSFLDRNPRRTTPGPLYIRQLTLHVSFRDDYTPDTWPATVDEIFKGMKALSLLETAAEFIGRIRVKADYAERGRKVEREREWVVAKPGTEGTLREEDVGGFHFGMSRTERNEREEAASFAGDAERL